MTGQDLPDLGRSGQQPPEELQDLPDIVASIVDTMRRGRIGRLVVSKGDFHLELERASTPIEAASVSRQDRQSDDDATESESDHGRHHTITSPMIGTYYSSPAPGEPPFVKVGDLVGQGDTIAIVEAMKIMNEISADRAGVVVDIVAINGETVEYGSPLIHLDTQQS